jgi:hypothetical protein
MSVLGRVNPVDVSRIMTRQLAQVRSLSPPPWRANCAMGLRMLHRRHSRSGGSLPIGGPGRYPSGGGGDGAGFFGGGPDGPNPSNGGGFGRGGGVFGGGGTDGPGGGALDGGDPCGGLPDGGGPDEAIVFGRGER